MVHESKLLWFLEERVFNREIRGSRYLKNRTTEGGQRVQQTLGTGSIQAYMSAIIDLWSHQKASGVNPYDHPRGKSVKAVLSARAQKEHVRRRTEFLDRAAGTLQDGYDEAKMKEIVRYCWTGHQELKNPTPQSVESFLRTAVDFLLSHSMLLRGETRRGAEFADFFTIPLTNEGPTPCNPMILIMDNGKMNQFGRLEYGAVVRHRDPLLCTLSHTAFYLFYRWAVMKEPVPCFQQRQQWYGLRFLKGEQGKKALSYETQLAWTNRIFHGAKLTIFKKTHAGRSQGARYAELSGVNEAQIRRAGRWNNDALSNCYLTHLPRKFVRAIAGFEPSVRGNYYLPRAKILPPSSLVQAVWPWVDQWLRWFDQNHSSYGTSDVGGEGFGLQPLPASEEDREDLAAQGFLRLLVELRTVLLQDSVLLQREFPHHPLWEDPLFVRPDYEEFAREVEQSLEDLEEPEEIRLRRAIPAIAERLNVVQLGLTQTVNEWGSRTHRTVKELNTRLDDFLLGRVSFILCPSNANGTDPLPLFVSPLL